MKISVVTPRYAISGVPLAQIRLARAFAAAGHDVHLVIGFINPGYVLPSLEGITVHLPNRPRVALMLGSLMRHFISVKPDVVFAAEDHLNIVTLLAAWLTRSNAKISCSSRVTPFDTYSRVPFSKRWFLKIAMRATMRRADALTCVSQDMVEQYRRVFRNAPHICIYNIVDDGHARPRMAEPVDEPWLADGTIPSLVAAGSLYPWKGFPDLIDAMDIVTRTRKARLLILGDGPQRAALQSRIDQLGLAECVKLVGYVDNPLKYFRRSKVFVLSSYVEGLPNVLVEAMMCGCTPVSTNCPTGPREVLQDGRYGYLVPMRDPAAMAAGIVQALDQPIPESLLREAIVPFQACAVINRHFEALDLASET